MDLYFLFANLACQMHSRDSFSREHKDNGDRTHCSTSHLLKQIFAEKNIHSQKKDKCVCNAPEMVNLAQKEDDNKCLL